MVWNYETKPCTFFVSDIEKARAVYVNKIGFMVIRENCRKERDDWKPDLWIDEHIELEIFQKRICQGEQTDQKPVFYVIWLSEWKAWRKL